MRIRLNSVQLWQRGRGAFRRGMSATWRTDLADADEMAALRARATGVSAILGIVADLSGLVAAPRLSTREWAGQGVVLTYLLLLTAWSRRGRRIKDLEYLGMIIGSYLYALGSVSLRVGSGRVALTALSMVTVSIMAAVFCGRRAHVVIQALVGIVVLVAAQQGDARTALTSVATSTGAFDIIVISFVVRLLRDLAVASLTRARQGEVTDPLTSLANRRGLERSGPQQWAARARSASPLAFMLIDVDHFKLINDTQGHAAGDEILRQLATVIMGGIRVDDLAVRLGGEEFLVLAGVTQGEGVSFGERLRTIIETEMHPLTVSIGVHELLPDNRPDMPAALWAAIDAADRALYEAKAAGRNRVVSSHS